ncbi:MAG: NepR family anti-sigma factor [Variibacter sp.]
MGKIEFGSVQSEASLGREIQSKIGEQLRALYDDVLDQGVPDRFVDLLRRLEDKDDGERR